MSRKSRLLGLTVLAVLVVGGAAWAGMAGFGLKGLGPQREVRRVVFVTIDTLRADHLKAYGYFRQQPLLDEFSERGIVFLNTYTASSHTAPSHTTMFTSLLPFQHQVLRNHDSLPAGAPHLAELASLAGFEVVGIPAVGFLEGKVGFSERPLDQDVPEAKFERRKWFRNATVQVDRAIHWLRTQQTNDKFLMWIHFYDVHQWEGMGNMPRKYLDEVQGDRPLEEVSAFVRERHGIPGDFFKSDKHLARAMNRYDARLRFVDAELQRLREALADEGYANNTLWIITSDHGEGLGNHNYAGHGEFLYQEQLHIPLIFFMENSPWPARRTTALTRTVDYLPTLKNVLSLPSVDGERFWQGHSLVPVLETGTWPAGRSPLSFAQRRPKDERSLRRDWEEGELFAVHDHTTKLIDHTQGVDELFLLEADPFELQNRQGQEAEVEEPLRKALADFLASPSPTLHKEEEELTPQSLEELKALGYL